MLADSAKEIMQKGSVLIVEDDEMVLQEMMVMLPDTIGTIDSARDGIEALEKFTQSR